MPEANGYFYSLWPAFSREIKTPKNVAPKQRKLRNPKGSTSRPRGRTWLADHR